MPLIDRDLFIDEYCKCCPHPCSKDSNAKCMTVYKISRMPVVDAVPVVHGEWISVDGTSECDEWDCSVCERRLTFGELLNAEDVYEWNHYCPNCGAKMDGGEEDGSE